MNTKRFGWYAWGVAAYNLLVILWGAFVRATGSGAGCGNHWPLCTGQLIPHSPQVETLIELSHRGSTGVLLFAVAGLVIGAFRLYPKGHPVRLGATLSAFFLFMEAALGAGLVLFEYVARNVSIARAWWDGTHLINTYFLVAVITLTAWWATGGKQLRWRGQGIVGWALLLAVLGELILGATGAVIAMGDTLVLQAGISPETSPVLAQIIALRIYHPMLAFGVGALLALAVWLVNWRRPSSEAKRFTRWLAVAFVVQLLLGAFNVALKAPVWLQLIHLLNADLIWMLFVLLGATALSQQATFVARPELKHTELTLPAQ